MMATTTDRLRSRADRLEQEASGLRRLARDLDLLQANEKTGGFRLTDEAQDALWKLAKL